MARPDETLLKALQGIEGVVNVRFEGGSAAIIQIKSSMIKSQNRKIPIPKPWKKSLKKKKVPILSLRKTTRLANISQNRCRLWHPRIYILKQS